MWNNNNDFGKNLDPNLKIPDDFDLFSLIMPDDIVEKYNKEKEKKLLETSEQEELKIEEVINGMELLKLNSVFEKIIPNNDWYPFFYDEMNKDYFKIIEKKYIEAKDNNFILPKEKRIFRAFKLTPLKSVRVVILGQDPYHSICKKSQKYHANGLAFSVNKECSIPPSLRNMFKEIKRTGFKGLKDGELEPWTKQGVLLMNTQLTVEKSNANSHKFWTKFTDNIISYLSDLKTPIVFVLMGGNALNKYKLIKRGKTKKIIVTSHPSPLGYKKPLRSYPPFFESNIFININKKLREMGEREIEW